MSGGIAPDLCRQVFEILIDGGEVMKAAQAEHLGTCMNCFRIMTELREAPRLASALRGEAPILPEDDAFWDRLAERTVAGAAAAVGGASGGEPGRLSIGDTGDPAPRAAASLRRPRRRALGIALGSVLAAGGAAAAIAMVARHGLQPPVATASYSARPTNAAASLGDEPWAAAEVIDLDRAGLRRLLDRLGANAPRALAGSSAELTDAPDAFVDDDARVNDELAELDGPALLRVAQSFERSRL